MENIGFGTCDLCGKENVVVTSCTYSGVWCKKCHELAVHEFKTAIKEINEFNKTNKVTAKRKKKNNLDELEETRRAAENSLRKLMGDPNFKLD